MLNLVYFPVLFWVITTVTCRSAPTAKQKCRQYSAEYLKYGYISGPSDNSVQVPVCIVSSKTLSNEVIKPSRLEAYLEKKHSDGTVQI